MSNGKKQHTSMRGVVVNMGELAAANANATAVSGGGLKMNARGDILAHGGQIAMSREDISREYQRSNNAVKHVSLKSPQPDEFETASQALARLTQAAEEQVELPAGAINKPKRKIVDKED